MNYLAALREEPPSDQGSSADEGAPSAGSGWTGIGSPMTVGTRYTSRSFCDGQSLASPGRWAPEQRRYPSHPTWSAVSSLFSSFTDTYGSPELLMRFGVGESWLLSIWFEGDNTAESGRRRFASWAGTRNQNFDRGLPGRAVGLSLLGTTSRC